MSGAALLNHVRPLPARATLAAALGADPQRVCAYYLCPLANLRGIAEGGILPNAAAPVDRIDLAGQGVQALREVPVLLTNENGTRDSTVHRCANFFWNPLNWTCRAFQWRALLREKATGNLDAGVLCILEIDVDTLLADDAHFWTVTPKNIAAWNFNNFTAPFISGGRLSAKGQPFFEWDAIFSFGQTNDGDLNQKRAAELIVFRETNFMEAASGPLPFGAVRRILIPDAGIRALTADQNAFLAAVGPPVQRLASDTEPQVFFTRDDLLWHEKQFVRNLIWRQADDPDVLAKFNSALLAVEEFERTHPELSPIANRFAHPQTARGPHGTAHIARVMCWSAFLVQHLPEEELARALPTVLSSAAIHDLCRQSNAEDEVHGAVVAERDGALIHQALVNPDFAASSLAAVRQHCIPDARCINTDLVWEILKDADALDRGRFAKPREEGGCNPTFFRTETLRTAGNDYIPWMAYYLARMTRYVEVDANPCARLAETLVLGVKTALADHAVA